MQPINLSIDLIQTAIYAALALGGYALRSLNVFGGKSTTPVTPPTTPVTPTNHPVLNQLIAAVESQIQAVLQNAVSGLVQPPAPVTPPKP